MTMADDLKRTGRRLWWWAGLCSAVVVSLPIGVFWWWCRDISPPAIDDLLLTPLVVAAEDDAFTHFERAAAAVVTGPEMTDKHYRQDCAKRQGKSEKLVEDNAEALRHLRVGLACKICAGRQQWRYDDNIPFTRLKHLGLVLTVQARLALRDGRRDEARTTCRELFAYSELLRQGPLGQVAMMVGQGVTFRGLETVRLIANDPGVTEAELAGLAELLAGIAPPEHGMAIALRAEFTRTANLIDKLESGGVPWSEVTTIERHRVLDGYQFQPNRTRLMLAEGTRAAIEEIGQPAAPVSASDDDGPSTDDSIRRNIVGRAVVGWMPSPRTIVRQKAQQNFAVTAARLVVALRRYETSTGVLPATLDALVPDYLSAVPEDPRLARPFRYLPAERLLSAGGIADGAPTKFHLRPEELPP